MNRRIINGLRNSKLSFSMIKSCSNLRCYSTETVMNVFDRKLKRHQKNKSALSDDHLVYDYLREEVSNKIIYILESNLDLSIVSLIWLYILYSLLDFKQANYMHCMNIFS